ncbi:kinesin-like protein KIN-12D [Magnolia sinica]|uniref:kinesin-like protein KIN-12D n=1 Tax=Magnolia sinica TaxID=86752 RepID=UPI00265914C8|nr:kinesin-like protein KIN-12D [Magnolia sinica]
MLKDFRIFRRNSGKNLHTEGNENLQGNSTDPSLNPAGSDSTRAPLNAIQDPSQNPRPVTDQELAQRSKIDRTPSKIRAKGPDAPLPFRTPEKHRVGSTAPRNRFGWAKNDPGSNSVEIREEANRLPTASRGAGFGNGGFTSMTPRSMRSFGRAASSHSESGSTQSTPTKSVNKPPNPGFCPSNGSRPPLSMGVRGGNFAALSKGISASSVPATIVNTVEVPYFELREDPSFWMDHNVQVLIRVRPLNNMERSLHGYNRCLKQESAQSISWIGQPDTRFTFDHVACETVNQEMLFRVAGLPMVENCLSGYNSCMFAYGQTGSGKTYTMLGEIDELEGRPSPDRGMTPRIFEFLFARIRAEEESRRDEKLRYSCKCSFLEIYNEQITDLLDPSSTNLLLREDMKKGVYVENLTEFEVETVNDILKLLIQGAANRKVAATNMNRESSRSHSVFTCVIESRWEKDSTTNLRFARLNLVDLAGSERQKTSGAEGERLKEAANINRSLSALGHVIMVLVDVAHGKQRHVPYRDSRLTFLLQDSLGGNSKTMIVANVSPSICCAGETLSTLKFAQRAKLIQNNAVVNEDASGDVVALQHQIHLLKEELSFLKRQNVSRSLSFRSTIFGDSDSEGCDTASEGNMIGMDHGNTNDSHECEPLGIIKVSTKQLKSLETTLAGALRREQMADTAIKQLDAEIEQLNRLVRQREEDTRCTKMMLRFREEKIHRMKSLLDGLMPTDSYLVEENNALTEEIQLLRARVDRNPEVTRFALENIRLLDQLRRFQDFYEEGEREILLAEVSELRDQLVQFLDRNSGQDKHPNLSIPPQEGTHIGFASSTKENDSLKIELKHTCEELEDCRNNLNSCLEINAKLSREIDELHSQLKNYKSSCLVQDANVESQKDLYSRFPSAEAQKCDTHLLETVQKKEEWDHEIMMKHDEEIMNLQLELDILKSILEEERSSHSEAEERALCLSKQCDHVKNELKNAKSVIEALESQQCLSINDMEELRDSNNQYAELMKKQEQEIIMLKKQFASHFEGDGKMSCAHQELRDQPLKHSENEDSPLQAKLKRMQSSLEKAWRLNVRYQSDQASQTSHEQEMDEVRMQVEAETAEVIVCLQEELATLQQQVDDSNTQELLAKQRLTLLETELKELQGRLDSLTQDNKRLGELLGEKDEDIRSLTEEWGKLACDIAEVLADGHEALEEASDQVESIVDSFPQRTWIGDQVGRMIRTISEKELLIEELQKHLQDAHEIRNDMEWKLRSLRGATLAITEAQQQESTEKEKEVLLLRSQLSAKVSVINELEEKVRLMEDQIKKAEICATVAFVIVNRFSEINSVHLKELKQREFQLDESVGMNLQKAALLQDQIVVTAEAERQIQELKVQLEGSEENTAQLELKLAEEQERVRAMEQQLENIEKDFSETTLADNLLKTKEKLNEFKLGVYTLNSCMNEYVEKDSGPAKVHTPGNHAATGVESDSEEWIDIEKTQGTGDSKSRYDQDIADSIERSVDGCLCECSFKVGKRVDDISQREVKGFPCGQEAFKSGKNLEDAHDKDVTILLLKKEIESALDSLRGVQDQMSKLLDEKDEIKNSEKQSQASIECLTAQVLQLQMEMNDMEKQFEFRVLDLKHKLEAVEEMAEEANTCYSMTKEVLEHELGEAKVVAIQKAAEASSLLSKFVEAQETMKEADVMVNALVTANETAKLEIERYKKMEASLTEDIDSLVNEVQRLQSSNDEKEQQYEHLEKQFYSNLAETHNQVQVLDEILTQMCTTSLEEFKSIVSDIHCLKSQLLHFVNLAKTWLEEIWSEIIVKDCAVSVLHLCHIGILLETVTGLNAENSFLHHGLYESNSAITDLREHNFRVKRELEVCSILKGKLLFDIKNSFHRIARKEEETGKLSAKLSCFEKKILDLQMQEETMLARSNSMGSELAVLMKEFDLSNRNRITAILDNDVLLKEIDELHCQLEESSSLQAQFQVHHAMFRDSICRELNLLVNVPPSEFHKSLNEERTGNIQTKEGIEYFKELINYQTELITVDLSAKDFESFILASELKQKTAELNKMEIRILDLERERDSFSAILEVVKREMISVNVDRELEVALLREEVEETHLQLDIVCGDKHDLLLKLNESSDRVVEMDKENKALEQDIQSLKEVADKQQSDLSSQSINLNRFRESSERLLEDLWVKEEALEYSSTQMSALDLQNQKLQDDVCLLQSSISRLQTELDIKNAEVNDIQHSNSIALNDFESKKLEMATVTGEMDAMRKENEKLKYEVQNLKAEHSRVFEDFESRKVEIEYSSRRIHVLDQENRELKDKICTLEACVTSLCTDLDTKVAELEELQHSHSIVGKDIEMQTATINALKLDNESFRQELVLMKRQKDEIVTSLSLNVKHCYDSIEGVDAIVKKSNTLQDRMFQEICEYEETAVKFITESECLKMSAKELLSENSSLWDELAWKDEVLKGLQFDLSLLQESASNAKDQKDEFEEVVARLELLEDELEVKANELDETLAHCKSLEAQLLEKANRISTLELELMEDQKSLKLASDENLELKAHMEDLLVTKNFIEEELMEKGKLIERLEEELIEMSDSLGRMNHNLEGLKSDLNEVTKERDCLDSEVLVLKEQLEMAQAVAEENEAIATEARQIAEARKNYAKEKEEEVKLLEKSVEELEYTVNVLENKVEIVKGEAERQRLQREELESELQVVKHQMLTVHTSAASQNQNVTRDGDHDEITRCLEEKSSDLQEAHNQIQILQKDMAEKDAEISHCKAHISELNMHAEAQAREYKQKFRELEAMAQQVKPESLSSYVVTNSTATKTEKNAVKSRGSGSPFKCIGLGLAQQVNSEKEEELTAGKHRIAELEALAASRQKEIFMLNTRLAAAESMTHDVVRDLLGVKLDMANYAALLDHMQVHKMAEKARVQNEESQEKEKEVVKLKQQLDEFIEERQGWLDEINRRNAEMVATKVALEKLQQRDQFLTTENQMLKVDNANHKKRVTELEDEVKKLSGQQNLQQRIHHHAKIKEENNFLKTRNEDLAGKLRRTEGLLSRLREELVRYRASSGKNPYVDIDEEQRLKNKLETAEEERVQLAQKLLSLCTGILKAAGVTRPVSDISPSMAEEALNQLKDRIASLELELQDMKFKSKISGEKIRLSELRQQSSPFSSTRTDENCPTPQPRRISRTPSISALK